MTADDGGTWMWSRACQMLEEAERRHRRFFELLSRPERTPTWEPPVDVFRADGGVQVVVALPGVRPDSVAIELRGRALTIRAHSPLPVRSGAARILRLEIPYGRIERRIELPPGRYQLAGYEFHHGSLHIHLTEVWS